jgi:hypothetical protein
MTRSLMTAGVAFLALGMAGTALAQTTTQDTAPAATPAPQAAPQPSPAAAGRDRVPPRDRAFDPTAQQVAMLHIGDVTPPLRRIGKTSPISAVPGARPPMVTLEPPTLRPVPGGVWQLTLNLTNNSARPIDARLACTFRNGSRPAADVNVLMRDVGPGDQVAADVAGPPVTTFVDSVSCDILPPQ